MATQIVINDPASQQHVPAPVIAIVSSDANNALQSGSDGNLFVRKDSSADRQLVSQQAGNYIRYGTDMGVFLDGNDVLSNGRTNLLHTSERDGRVELTADDLKAAGIGSGDVTRDEFDRLKTEVTTVEGDLDGVKDTVDNIKTKVDAVVVVSKDRKNVLYEGSDKGAMLSEDDIVDVVKDAGITKTEARDLINAGTDKFLTVQGDRIVSGMSVQFNPATSQLSILGVNGTQVASVNLPTAIASVASAAVEVNPAGQATGTYIHFVFNRTDNTQAHTYVNVTDIAGGGSIVVVSADAGNLLEKGTDKGALLTSSKVVAAVGDSIKDIAKDAIKKAIQDGDVKVVSTDSGNVVKTGTDGGAYMSKTDLANSVTNVIKSGDLKLFSEDTGNRIKPGSDGGIYMGDTEINNTVQQAIKSGDVSIVSTDTGNTLSVGADGGAYLDESDIPAPEPSTDAGNVLSVGTDGKLYFKPTTDYGTL